MQASSLFAKPRSWQSARPVPQSRRIHSIRASAAPSSSSSSCGSSEGAVTVSEGAVSGCSKGTCGGGCSSSSGAGAASFEAYLNNASTMNTLMSTQSVELSRQDIAAAFQSKPETSGATQGERVISISELLASCPPDLIWEEDEDGQVL